MTVDMQARRDAFLMLTDERPPEQPKRWLIVYTDESGSRTWSQHDFGMDAEHHRKRLAQRVLMPQLHDLDA